MVFTGLRGLLVLGAGLLLAAIDIDYLYSGLQTPTPLHAVGHTEHPDYANTRREVLLPDWEIYDCHHHLFDTSQPRVLFKVVQALYILKPQVRHRLMRFIYGLVSGPLAKLGNSRHANPDSYGTMAVFENFTVANLKAGFDGHKVVRTTHVMTTTEHDVDYTPIAETRWCAAQKKATGLPSTIVAFIDLMQSTEDVQKDIALHKAASPDFKSVRYFVAHDDDPAIPNYNKKDIFLSPQFQESFEALGQAGIMFDAWLYHPQLQSFADWLERAKPSTQVVLEHIGYPLRGGRYTEANEKEVIDKWRWGLRAMANVENVIGVKFSAVGMVQTIPGAQLLQKTRGRRAATQEEIVEVLKPFVEDIVEFFGADRVMFGSNFPMDSVTVTYQALYNAYKQILLDGVQDGRWLEVQAQAMLYGNAKRIYG